MLGDATKKIGTMVELAEELYEKVTQMREQMTDLTGAVEDTHEKVVALERQVAVQGALLEEVAADHGVDVDGVRAEVEADFDREEEPPESTEDAATGDA